MSIGGMWVKHEMGGGEVEEVVGVRVDKWRL